MLVSEKDQYWNCEGELQKGHWEEQKYVCAFLWDLRIQGEEQEQELCKNCHVEEAKQVNSQVSGDELAIEMVVLQDNSHGMMRGSFGEAGLAFANWCVISSLSMQGIHAIH